MAAFAVPWLLLFCLACTSPAERQSPTVTQPGLLTVGLHAQPVTLDPHRQNDIASRSVLSNVYQALVSFDSEMRLRPQLAVSWDNPDDLTWRFELQANGRFHDGRPVTATDVVFSLQRARRLEGSRVASAVGTIAEARAEGDRVVELTTAYPDPLLLNKLTQVFIVPAGSPDQLTRDVGSGPYRLTSPLGPSIDLQSVAGFPECAAGPTRARFEAVEDREARLSGLESGKLDLVSGLRPKDLDRLAGMARASAVSRPGLMVVFILLRVDRPPFDDLRVRRAVDLAVDRRALVEVSQRGLGLPVGQMASPFVFGYAKQIAPSPYDPAEARRLLTDAGYPKGLSLRLEHREGLDLSLLAKQMAAAGIHVELTPLPWPELKERLDRGEVSAFYAGWRPSGSEISDLLVETMHTPTADGRYGGSNWGGFSDPVLDSLTEQLKSSWGGDGRKAVLEAALTRMADQKLLTPLYVPNDIWGLSDALEWTPRLDAQVELCEVQHRGP